MNRRMKRLIASMLAVTMLLSNSSLTVVAEKANNEAESVAVEVNQYSSEAAAESNSEETSEAPSEDTLHRSASANSDGEASDADVLGKDVEISDGESSQTNDAEELSADEEKNTTADEKTIQTVQELVELSKENASTYQNAKIVLAPHDTTGLDLSETEFQGLGSDEYPFKGSIGFSGEYTGYITLAKSLFNAISEDAQITSTLNLKAAKNMTDPILAKKYIAGSDLGSNSRVINLKIDAKSKDTTEGGEQTSYSSFGGIIGTLGENASVSLNITNVIPAAKTAVTGDGNRGFFCNTLEAKASLTINSFSGTADFQITSADGTAGAIVGYM